MDKEQLLQRATKGKITTANMPTLSLAYDDLNMNYTLGKQLIYGTLTESSPDNTVLYGLPVSLAQLKGLDLFDKAILQMLLANVVTLNDSDFSNNVEYQKETWVDNLVALITVLNDRGILDSLIKEEN